MPNKTEDAGFHIKHWRGILLVVEITSFLLIFLGLLLNPYFLGIILKKQSHFSYATDMFIYKSEAILALSGIVLYLVYRFCLINASGKVREIVLDIIVSLFLLLAVLVLAELSIRIFFPQNTLSRIGSNYPPIMEEGQHISWQFRPNSSGMMYNGEFNVSYSVNSLGMRDRERSLEKADGKRRVLVLGDSFTEGVGVEQNSTYPALLEKILQGEGKNVEVWNAGVGGYSADTEYVYLRNNIDSIKPDMVLLGFYAGNDITDISKNQWEVDDEGLPTHVKSKVMFVENGQLMFNYNDTNPLSVGMSRYVRMVLMKTSQLYVLINNIVSGAGNADTEIVPLLSKNPSEEVSYDLNKTRELLRAMKSLSESEGASFMVVIIPARSQVNEKEWRFLQKEFNSDGLVRDLVQQEIKVWCLEENVTCIDLLPEFMNGAENLYNSLTDIHFNEKGQLKTAEAIAEHID